MEQGNIIGWLSIDWEVSLVAVVYKPRLSLSDFSEGQWCVQQSHFVDSETNGLSHCPHGAYDRGGGLASGGGERQRTGQKL